MVGDFALSSSEVLVEGDDYSYENNVLTILSGKEIAVSGATTADRIVVSTSDGSKASLALDGVSIDVSAVYGIAALWIDSTGGLDLALADGTENFLKSGSSCAGLQNDANPLTISGGTGKLIAVGGSGAAGIGGLDGSNIVITGGTVTAKAGGGAAGIGGFRDGSNIVITGGTVTAEGGSQGAGIGGGNAGDGFDIVIEGGTVTAKSDNYGAGIGGGNYGDGSGISIEGGTVTAEGCEIVDSGDMEFPRAVTYPTGGLVVEGGVPTVDYVYASGALTVKTAEPLTVRNADPDTPTADRIVVDTGDVRASVTLAGVDIDVSGTDDAAALLVSSEGGLDLALADGSVNTLKSASGCAGLQNGGFPLTISGNTGALTAAGGDFAAGIGGGDGGDGSNITIEGGTVTATGTSGGAGIGGGSGGGSSGGSGSGISIEGGAVTATGSSFAAGIGGGNGARGGGSGSGISVSGGTVEATGGDFGAGIGGGYKGAGGTADAPVSVSGGCVSATAGLNAQAIGNGNGAKGDPVVSVTGGFFKDGDAGKNTVCGVTPDAGFAVFEDGTHEGYPFAVIYATGDFEVSGEGLVWNEDYAYSYETHVLTILSGKGITVGMRAGVAQTKTDRIVVKTDDAAVRANLTLAGVNIDVPDTDNVAALQVDSEGGLDLALADGSENTLESGLFCAGLQNGTNPLMISGSTGELTAVGGSAGAGIGAGFGDGSNITIAGGTVTAKGGGGGAGIGGGDHGNGSNIAVTGGTVTAEGGNYASGIGGGMGGVGGTEDAPVSITGGRVSATAGQYSDAQAIGNGGGADAERDPVVSITGGLFADYGGKLPDVGLPRGEVYGVEPADGCGVYDGTGVDGYPCAVGPQASLSLKAFASYTGEALTAGAVLEEASYGGEDAFDEVGAAYKPAGGEGGLVHGLPTEAGKYVVRAFLPAKEVGGKTYARAVVEAGFEVRQGAADLGFEASEENPTYGDTVTFSVTPTLAAGDSNELSRTASRATVYVGEPDRGGVEVGSSAEVKQGEKTTIEVDTAIRVDGKRAFRIGENQVYVRVEGLANLEDATAGPLTVTVKPKELSAFAITGDASKAYDGKVATPDATGGAEAAPFNTLAVGFEGALKGDAVSVAASFTFDGTDAGTKGVTATVAGLEGDDKGCYKLPDKVAPLAYKVATGIVKASAKLNGGASLDVTNGMARTYELDLSALRPKDLAEGCSLGKVTYKLGEVKLGDYYDANNPASITPEGLLLVPVKPMATEEEGSIGFVGVTVSSTNYAFKDDGAASVAVSAVNRAAPSGSPDLEGEGSIVYGQPLSAIGLSGSMSAPGVEEVAGEFRWDEPGAVLPAGSQKAGWTFFPDDVAAFEPVSGESLVEVARRPVTIVGATAKDKTYDGTTAAEVGSPGEVSGALEGDDVRVDASAATAAFASADAGQGIEVTFAGFKLAGEAAGNYELSAQPAPAAADIARLANEWTVPLSIEGWTAGEAPKAPTASALFGEVEFSYAPLPDGPWSSAAPTTAGSYYVRALVEEGNWDGLSATAAFTVAAAPAPAPGPEDPSDAPGTGSGGKALAPTGDAAAPAALALAALGSAAALAALAARRRDRGRG